MISNYLVLLNINVNMNVKYIKLWCIITVLIIIVIIIVIMVKTCRWVLPQKLSKDDILIIELVSHTKVKGKG